MINDDVYCLFIIEIYRIMHIIRSMQRVLFVLGPTISVCGKPPILTIILLQHKCLYETDPSHTHLIFWAKAVSTEIREIFTKYWAIQKRHNDNISSIGYMAKENVLLVPE